MIEIDPRRTKNKRAMFRAACERGDMHAESTDASASISIDRD